MGSQTGQEPLAQSMKPGTMLGRYQLLSTLGAGGMATVYLAELRGEQGFSRRVALKVVHAHLAVQPDFSQWFISEARLGGVLHHPNLVATLDFGQLEGHWFMAMEYVDGWTLHELARLLLPAHPTLPLAISCQVMIQICRGLQHAHQARDPSGQPLNMVHRDIKPSNILIDRHGTAKLADFGVARAESNLHKTVASGVVKGSFRHMPPEQALASRDLDARADLFAMGTVFYQLLTGRAVYQADNQMQALRMAMDGEVGPALAALPSLPSQGRILNILTRTLAKEREARYSSAAELEEALTELLYAVGTLPLLNTRWLEEAQRAATQHVEAIQRSRQEWLTPSMAVEEQPTTPSHPNQAAVSPMVSNGVAQAAPAGRTPSSDGPSSDGPSSDGASGGLAGASADQPAPDVAVLVSKGNSTYTNRIEGIGVAPVAPAPPAKVEESLAQPETATKRWGVFLALLGVGVLLLLGWVWGERLLLVSPLTGGPLTGGPLTGSPPARGVQTTAEKLDSAGPSAPKTGVAQRVAQQVAQEQPGREGLDSASPSASEEEGAGRAVVATSAQATIGSASEASGVRVAEGAVVSGKESSSGGGGGRKSAGLGASRSGGREAVSPELGATYDPSRSGVV